MEKFNPSLRTLGALAAVTLNDFDERPARHFREIEPDATSWRDAFRRLYEKYRAERRTVIDLLDELDEHMTARDRMWNYMFGEMQEQEARIPDYAANEAAAEANRQRELKQAVVYYVKMNDTIKIGTTTRLRNRIAAFSIGFDAILAIEPGGYDRERERHKQFAHLRVNGRNEWFRPEDDLLEHVRLARDTFGDPLDFL